MLSAIFCAIEEDNHSGLEELLEVANIDVNQTNKHGESGVHIAAGLGRLEMLRVLGGHGADLTKLDSQGDSAVYWAARQGHTPVIEYLVTQGVRVDQQNKVSEGEQLAAVLMFLVLLYFVFHFSQLGEACIHTGCKYGHTGVIQYLVTRTDNIDCQDHVS